MVLGSQFFSGSDIQTDASAKIFRIGTPHYTNAEEPVTMMMGYNSSATINQLNIGGGTSVGNAVTQIDLYTAANSTTVTGTSRMTILAGGNVGINDIAPAEKLEVTGNVKATHFYTGYNWTGKTAGMNFGVDGAAGGLGFYDGTTAASASIYRDTDSKFYIGVRSGVATYGLTIDTIGNVGIGIICSNRKITCCW